MDVRPYLPADREACLAVFDSNTPQFFHASERTAFDQFLDSRAANYFVMEHDGNIVGCGGFAIEENPQQASLTWGMIRKDLHRNGLGRFLLMFRLREIGKASSAGMVRLSTSQHSQRFFESQGFRVLEVIPDGFASGIDKIEMAKKLSVCA